MAAPKLLRLLFNMSYEKLIDLCVEKLAFLRRDQSDLASRGITTAKIDAFDAERTAFTAIPSNTTGLETNTLGYEARDKQAAILLTDIQAVQTVVGDTFKTSSAQYKGFQFKGLGKFDASQLYNVSENVVVKANKYILDLGPKGLTPAMLTNITTQATLLLPLIAAMPILVGDAETSTVERRSASNALFTTAKGLCSTGKAFYTTAKNKVKAKNYVIYDTVSKVIDRTGIVKAMLSLVRKTAGMTATTKVRMKVKSGTSLQFYFGITKNSLPGVLSTIVNYNPNIFVQKTAAELGYNAAAGITVFVIRNINGDDASFLAKFG